MQDPLRSVGTDDVKLNVAVYVQGNAKGKENNKKKTNPNQHCISVTNCESPDHTFTGHVPLKMFLTFCHSAGRTVGAQEKKSLILI